MKKLTLDEVKQRIFEVHGDKYSYDFSGYVNATTKIQITCAEHGVFWQTPKDHMKGRGCMRCGKESMGFKQAVKWDDFLVAARLKHGDRYEYPEQDFDSNPHATKLVDIICKKHGLFRQKRILHTSGRGCPSCKSELIGNRTRHTFDEFVSKAILVHGDKYDYPEQPYINSHTLVEIACKTHGLFKQKPANHLSGRGCMSCYVDTKGVNSRDTFDEFVTKARLVHGGKYSYHYDGYSRSQDDALITCPDHGNFWQIANGHKNGQGCPKCTHTGISRLEKNILKEFAHYPHVENFRLVLDETCPKLSKGDVYLSRYTELDIYFEQNNVAVEVHGLYFHNEDRTGKNYHLDKLKVCNHRNIDLIQIFEDEWLTKPDIVKSIINARLGMFGERYYARKTERKQVDTHIAKVFYDTNHIQGYTAASLHYGLYYNGELVAMASFGNRSNLFKDNTLELIRFCNKLNCQVVGGLNKLLKGFDTIKTYCDLRLFNGHGYKQAGFEVTHTSPPGYTYARANTRFSRFSFQKHKLAEKLEKYDTNKSEVENMRDNGYRRIFDCGNLVMIRHPQHHR